MNPIYNEYIQFLNSYSVNIPDLKEGYFWLDNSIIKAYDTNGNLHKIYRIKIDNNLNITCSTYQNKEFSIESWQDTINRNKNRLDERERERALT